MTTRTTLDRGMVDGRRSAMTTWRRQTGAGVLVSCAVALTAQPGAQAPYTIAYASFGPLTTAVFVSNADGTQERMLAGNPALDSNPSFTPDGRAVLFTSTRDGSADIYRIRLDGTNLERLTNDPAFDDQATMSPDGTRIAFVSSRTGQADIWLLELSRPHGHRRAIESPSDSAAFFPLQRGTGRRRSPSSTVTVPDCAG